MRHPLKPYRHFIKRAAEVEPFIHKNIDLTKTIADYSTKILKKYHINAVLVGSDQVWRYSWNSHYIEDMYLAFAKDYPCLKIVYGASFGVENWDYPEGTTANVRELVKQFKQISVRENSAKDLCETHLGAKAITVLDPTLLLSASDYEQFCAAPNPQDPPYLAAYILDINEDKSTYIKALAKSMNLEIKEMTVSGQEVSIEKWLTTIRNASFVITDSYHGCLFSVLFKKQFQSIINKERGADRFVTVLSALGLQDQLLYDIKTGPVFPAAIDYTDVSLRLKNLREFSSAFLLDSIH